MSINRSDKDEGKFVFAVVEGGDKDDPDPEKAGRVRVREIGVHGPLVKTEHLKFLQHVSHSGSQHETPRPPRPGQLVQVMKTLDGYGYITGIAMGIGSQIAGSFDKLVPQLQTAVNKLTGMRIPPNVKDATSSNRSGLPGMIKEIEEKVEKDMQALYNGLPSHGALPSIAGLINNPVRQVSTALSQLQDVLDSNILSQLPGQLFSAGNLLNLLDTDQLKEVMDSIPTEIQGALNNMMTLKQSAISGALPGNFMLGGIVNPQTFLPNMISKLKGVTTVGELDKVLHGLAADSLSSAAQEGLDAIESTVQGLFGDFKKILSLDGIISTVASEAMEALQSQFSSLLGGIPSAANVLFGSDSKIPELMKRLKSDDLIKEMKESLEQNHPSKSAKRATLTRGGSSGATLGSETFLA